MKHLLCKSELLVLQSIKHHLCQSELLVLQSIKHHLCVKWIIGITINKTTSLC